MTHVKAHLAAGYAGGRVFAAVAYYDASAEPSGGAGISVDAISATPGDGTCSGIERTALIRFLDKALANGWMVDVNVDPSACPIEMDGVVKKYGDSVELYEDGVRYGTLHRTDPMAPHFASSASVQLANAARRAAGVPLLQLEEERTIFV